jgi:hypothetical protein
MIVTDCTGSCKSNYHTIITTTAPIYILNISTNKYICHFSIALTACSNIETVNGGDIVKFPDVKINYGIQNLTLFKQTGIFTCEQKGLYIFFSNILSNTANAYFRWYLNSSTPLSAIYVSSQNGYQSGSGMVTVELALGDTLSLKSQNNNIRFDSTSCYTLIKIK